MYDLGSTRSVSRRDHVLFTPDSFVRAAFPGLTKGMAIVHVSPRVGAQFTQYTVELEAGGTLRDTGQQRFAYVLQGHVNLERGGQTKQLEHGSYAYVPAGEAHTFKALAPAHLTIIEKPFVSAPGLSAPEAFIGHESDVKPSPLKTPQGTFDDAIAVRMLVPDDARYDFAVNSMTYKPGAALPQVEIHVMEHGLVMLEGGGIYRLGEHWYPTKAGDFIWMAPYCPQWFGALGKSDAKYLIFKDWNRHPLP